MPTTPKVEITCSRCKATIIVDIDQDSPGREPVWPKKWNTLVPHRGSFRSGIASDLCDRCTVALDAFLRGMPVVASATPIEPLIWARDFIDRSRTSDRAHTASEVIKVLDPIIEQLKKEGQDASRT